MRISKITVFAAVLTLGLTSGAMAKNGGGGQAFLLTNAAMIQEVAAMAQMAARQHPARRTLRLIAIKRLRRIPRIRVNTVRWERSTNNSEPAKKSPAAMSWRGLFCLIRSNAFRRSSWPAAVTPPRERRHVRRRTTAFRDLTKILPGPRSNSRQFTAAPSRRTILRQVAWALRCRAPASWPVIPQYPSRRRVHEKVEV